MLQPTAISNLIATQTLCSDPSQTKTGKKCKTLRRLAFEQKLTNEEMQLLSDINFRLNSLEEVYEEADFDQVLGRLVEYEKENKAGYQIPKKYKPDPELGAWVTMVRRIGRDQMEPERRDKLDAIGFAWVSTRKCGSSFMSSYRSIKERLEEAVVNQEGSNGDDLRLSILAEEDVKRWINAQRLAAEKGNLSEARCEYMDQLPGVHWREPV